MAHGSRGWTREAWDRVVASDPGLNRARMAVSAAIAMASAMGLEYGFARVTHAGPQGTLVAMLLGTIMAMMGSMALSGTGVWPKVRTAVFFPVMIGAGMVVGVAVAGHTDLMLGVFVVVMFIAVYVRRFGLAFFFYGFMIWMGYFFAAFLGATISAVPAMLYAVCVATAWILLLSVTVLRTNTRRTLRRTQAAFGARSRAVARACADLLEADPTARRRVDRLRRRLHGRQLRLAEAALMIEGWSAEPGALPKGWSAPALRRRLLDAHLAVDALATSAEALAADGGVLVPTAARITGLMARREYRAALELARPLLESPAVGAAPEPDRAASGGPWPGHHLAAAAVEFVTLALDAAGPPDADPADPTGLAESAEPQAGSTPVVVLAQGMLPGSAAVAGEVDARGSGWNPLSRLNLTTRQSIQVVVAGTLAIVAGREVSETRYYWAVLAAFIAFAGTATRSETTIKAFNRVLGTLVGLGAGVAFAHLTAGHTMWVLVVIVVSMSFGFYLVTVSYASMIFFVTIMVSQLYSVLHEFSAGLLVLRLEETALGAAIGIAVALVVLPTSTRDTVRTARHRFFAALAELLGASATRLEAGYPGTADSVQDGSLDAELDSLTLAMDHRMQQLALVARPLTRPLVWGSDPRLVRHRLTLFAAATRHTRALAMAPRRFPDGDHPAELAAACRSLAQAAQELAAGPLPHGHPAPEVEGRLAAAEAALLAHRPQCPGTQLPPLTGPLVHLRQLLGELAVVPGTLALPPRPVATARTTPGAHERAPGASALAVLPLPAGGPGPAIRGLVRDGSGTAVPSATLTLTDVNGRQLGRAVPRADGRFLMDVPGPGGYLLIGSAGEHRPRAVAVTVADRLVDVTVLLDRLGGLTGSVRDAVSGAPVPGAALTVTDAEGRTAAGGRPGEDGGFLFAGLTPGSYTVTAVSAGHRPVSERVEVTGGEPVRHEVRLAPGARVSGTVRGRTGVPVPEARVTLLDPTGNLVGSATTDPDGRFGFPSLSPGEYTMITRGHFPATGSVAVPKGGRADLDLVLSPHLTARA